MQRKALGTGDTAEPQKKRLELPRWKKMVERGGVEGRHRETCFSRVWAAITKQCRLGRGLYNIYSWFTQGQLFAVSSHGGQREVSSLFLIL